MPEPRNTSESLGLKIALIFLAGLANILLGIVLVTVNDVRTQNVELNARLNRLEITIATDYVRKSDLREIVTGLAEATKSDKLSSGFFSWHTFAPLPIPISSGPLPKNPRIKSASLIWRTFSIFSPLW